MAETYEEDCCDCGGCGWTGEAGCCGNPLRSGECCGNAIQVQAQCQTCGGRGVVGGFQMPANNSGATHDR